MHANADDQPAIGDDQFVASAWEIAVSAVIVVGFVGGLAAWEHSKNQREDEERTRGIEQDMRDRRVREYEQREEAEYEREHPCGRKVEMLTENGDAYVVCDRDVRDSEVRGWVRRYPIDAGH